MFTTGLTAVGIVPKRFKYRVIVKYTSECAQGVVNEFGFPGAVYRLGEVDNDDEYVELYFRRRADAVLCLLKF